MDTVPAVGLLLVTMQTYTCTTTNSGGNVLPTFYATIFCQ